MCHMFSNHLLATMLVIVLAFGAVAGVPSSEGQPVNRSIAEVDQGRLEAEDFTFGCPIESFPPMTGDASNSIEEGGDASEGFYVRANVYSSDQCSLRFIIPNHPGGVATDIRLRTANPDGERIYVSVWTGIGFVVSTDHELHASTGQVVVADEWTTMPLETYNSIESGHEWMSVAIFNTNGDRVDFDYLSIQS